MILELITEQDFQRSREKTQMENGWAKLEKIKTDFIQVNLKNMSSTFFQDHLNLYKIVIING